MKLLQKQSSCLNEDFNKNGQNVYYLYFYDIAYSYNITDRKQLSPEIFRSRYLFLDIDRRFYLKGSS